MNLSGGQELSIRVFTGGEKSLLLWLPSERGAGASDEFHARALAGLGHSVWLPDLHDAFFLQPDRASISKIPVEDIVGLIDAAAAGDAPVFLMSSARGAQLALIAAREWQLQNPANQRLRGLVLMNAYVYELGEQVSPQIDYLPIARATNLPVYLLDAEFSTTSLRIRQLAEVLGSGGSQVYTQVLKGLRGGFYSRNDSDLEPQELAAKRAFAATIDRSIGLLSHSRVPKTAAPGGDDARRFSDVPKQSLSLLRLQQAVVTPTLRLRDFDGQQFDLEQRRGKVTLLNFWASWCGPCVTEIPSLHSLKVRIDNPDFEIVSINMGESHAQVAEFVQQVPIEFPILMDIDGDVSRNWNIYFYPSSYLVDGEGKIRYAYLGALEWDSAENVAIIRNLLGIP